MLEISWTLPVAFVSVIIFLLLLNRILFKPLVRFMEAREKGIAQDLAEAARLRQAAEAALTTYQAALATARRDETEQLTAAQRAIEAQQREIIERARSEAGTMVTEAQARIARETEAARARVVAEAPELAQLLAAKLVGR